MIDNRVGRSIVQIVPLLSFPYELCCTVRKRIMGVCCIPRSGLEYFEIGTVVEGDMDMPGKHLILASTSPRRKELLETVGAAFEIIPSGVDEQILPSWTPLEVVLHLSAQKAEAVYQKQADYSGKVIIAADTVVAAGEHILGKPTDRSDARRMLKMLQGRTHEVYTGVTCIDGDTGRSLAKYQRTEVTLKNASDDEIDRYVMTGEPMDKAGSYAIQGIGALFVNRINGDYFNVVGLPLFTLNEMLSQFGAVLL